MLRALRQIRVALDMTTKRVSFSAVGDGSASWFDRPDVQHAVRSVLATIGRRSVGHDPPTCCQLLPADVYTPVRIAATLERELRFRFPNQRIEVRSAHVAN